MHRYKCRIVGSGCNLLIDPGHFKVTPETDFKINTFRYCCILLNVIVNNLVNLYIHFYGSLECIYFLLQNQSFASFVGTANYKLTQHVYSFLILFIRDVYTPEMEVINTKAP